MLHGFCCQEFFACYPKQAIFMYYDKHMHLMYVIISPTTDILTDV